MQRRTLWIVLASVAGVLLVVCLAAGAIGLIAYRYIGAQQQRLEAITRQLETIPSIAATEPSSTPSAVRPTATPTIEPDASASEQATAQSSAAVEASNAPVTSSPLPLPEGDSALVATGLTIDEQSDLAQRPDVPLYTINATFDPQGHTITGSERIILHNTEDVPFDALYLRLYVNAPHYKEAEMTLSNVRVNGATVTPALSLEDTAAQLPLAQSLTPGQQATIELDFSAVVPRSGGGYGLFNESQGIFLLYNWHPELAVYEKGSWLLNPVVNRGDPTNTDAANYLVTFSAVPIHGGDQRRACAGRRPGRRRDRASFCGRVDP